MTLRKTKAMYFLAAESKATERKFQMTEADSWTGAKTPAKWKIHCQVDWPTLHWKNRWGTDSTSVRQRLHLDARETPKRWRGVWVGVFWSIRRHPKQVVLGRHKPFQLRGTQVALGALDLIVFHAKDEGEITICRVLPSERIWPIMDYS